ncbi:hypothetical protein RGUI_1257 [Rhodovulum sp. P5]|uniref:choice-of-anchor E domain-containing protein n=1 Tax=Rhodovulum sp. P5 TaxID=1564506 RepID=UPI0009C259C1|nr:choice-of-anchor E domain-containing protein [Rhodovulum sp. P5]ARE39398.1 hypothetical protein RGUI_1257 [Rhodovulum sp. P5]
MKRFFYQGEPMKKVLLATAAAAAFGTAASADILEYADIYPLSTTNWDGTISIAQFDSSLGTLNSVYLELRGYVEGSSRVESLDAAPSTITAELSAELSMSTAALSDILVTLPVVSEMFDAEAFDGTIDFAGGSGTEWLDQMADDMDDATLTGSDMDEFIGMGSIDLILEAIGMSTASGAGNIITQFATSAGADIYVRYDYTPNAPAVPLPAGLPLLLAGLGAFGVVRARKG